MEAYAFAVKPYSSRITLLIGPATQEELFQEFRDRKISRHEALELSRYCRDEAKDFSAVTLISGEHSGRMFIYFPKAPDLTKPRSVDTISHEVMHCVVAIMKRAQIRLTDTSEEAFAYLMGQIMHDIWTRLNRRSRKPRPDWAVQPLG